MHDEASSRISAVGSSHFVAPPRFQAFSASITIRRFSRPPTSAMSLRRTVPGLISSGVTTAASW
jgi:hypothetical protein